MTNRLLISEFLPSMFRRSGLGNCASVGRRSIFAIAARVAAALITVLAGSASAMAAASDGAEPPMRRALLVGIDHYPALSDSEQLRGSVNDALLMQQVLIERLGFEADDVHVLVNEQATAAAIRGALQQLAEEVQSMAEGQRRQQVVFHFSGHGSQVPDQPEGEDRDEQDGLDETLVPYDATRQGSEADIRDDELYHWAHAVCSAENAQLWMILDCCHSGTGTRGTTRVRKLQRSALPAPAAPVGAGEASPWAQRSLPKGAVLLSACLAREVEPEYEEEGGQAYGLLSRFLAQVLNEKANVSQLSYDRLREAIQNRYRRDPAVMQPPTPQLEADGDTRRAPVLGGGSELDRHPVWPVAPHGRDPSRALLMAGAFHGVTRSSLYEFYSHLEKALSAATDPPAAVSLGWLRVDELTGATAQCRVLRRDGEEMVDGELPASFRGGYAVERIHHPGDFVLRVRVVQADEPDDGPALEPDDPALPAAVYDALTAAVDQSETPWLRWVSGGEPCDLVIRLAGEWAALIPAGGLAHIPNDGSANAADQPAAPDVPAALRGGWGPIDLGEREKAATQLHDWLRRITRARNLIRLASTEHDTSIQVKLELVSVMVDDDYNVTKWTPWPLHEDSHGQQSLMMRDGSLYTVRVSNVESAETGKPFYVTVLHVDAHMGIDVLLPFQEGADPAEEQKVAPGQSRLSGAWQCNSDDPDAGPKVHGPRWAIALATREPHDFSMMRHPSLPAVRAAGTPDGSLHELLLQQTYFRTRGDKPRRPVKLFDESWKAAVVEWVAVP